MTLLTVVKDVCAAVGVMVPQTVFGGINSDRTMTEMLALANEMAQRIAYDTRDWTMLRKQYQIIGDGVRLPGPNLIDPSDDVLAGSTAFNLPADYKRMLLTSSVWRSTNTQAPMMFVPDTDEWMHRRRMNPSTVLGEWTIMGGQMHIYPLMMAAIPGPPAVPADTATFAYLDKNCVALTSGGFGDRFMADSDTFRLDERLLKLGMIWQWMANKGSPYAEPMGTYSDAIANAMGRDQPAPILIGRTPSSWNTRVAYPWKPI